jgi:adenosine deaminase
MASAHGLDPSGVVEAVIDGVNRGSREFCIPVKLIGILSRTYGVEGSRTELKALLDHSEHLVAVDLAGDESNYPAEWFEDHFRKVRQAGLHITVHAGEIASADSVWQSIKLLGAERIGHALHAVDDPSLMDFLAENRIAIESCLTSNIQTSCVPNYIDHPLRKFLDHGICATINTDDPGISAVTIQDEYEIAAPAAGLSPEHIRQAQLNALEAAFLTAEEKQNLIKAHQSG